MAPIVLTAHADEDLDPDRDAACPEPAGRPPAPARSARARAAHSVSPGPSSPGSSGSGPSAAASTASLRLPAGRQPRAPRPSALATTSGRARPRQRPASPRPAPFTPSTAQRGPAGWPAVPARPGQRSARPGRAGGDRDRSLRLRLVYREDPGRHRRSAGRSPTRSRRSSRPVAGRPGHGRHRLLRGRQPGGRPGPGAQWARLHRIPSALDQGTPCQPERSRVGRHPGAAS